MHEHDDLMDGMPPDTALCLDLCDAIGGETMMGPETHAILPDGRLMAQSIASAVQQDLRPEGLSLVKLMERARRHLDDLGYNTAVGEMCVHFTGMDNDIPVAIMKVIVGPKEQDNG